MLSTAKSNFPTAMQIQRNKNSETFDKKVRKAELNNWIITGERKSSHGAGLSASRNKSQFTLT